MAKTKRIAIYPGSFDPFTNGHLDIVERAHGLFDELIILVAKSERKSPFLSPEERVQLVQKLVKGKWKNVKVDSWDGLLVDYAKKHKACALVRGLRAASDFEFEFMMAAMNRELNPAIETVFLMTGENLFFVSSSMVKEIIRFGGDASPYLPKVVDGYLKQKRKKGEL